MSVITVGLNPAIDRVIYCEHFAPGDHRSVHTVARLAAGKAANVSRALALCGVPNIAAGFIGAADAPWFKHDLEVAGPISCQFIETAGQTRENITLLDPHTRQETHLRDAGFTVFPGDLQRLKDWLTGHTGAADTVAFAGSLPPGITPDDLMALLDGCPAGARRVVDSSGPALAAAVQRPLWLIKPNATELAELLHREIDPEPEAVLAAVCATALPVEHVLVSLGPRGAVLVRPREGIRGRAIHAVARLDRPVVRTVGCGDHLLGGFLAGMAASNDVVAALRAGVALASARAVSAEFAGVDRELLAEVAKNISIRIF